MTSNIKTSIHKYFSTGFVLNEADLRRLHQIMLSAAAKLQDANEQSYFHVRTEDGTVYKFDAIDEIFSLDNIGQRVVVFLYMSVGNSQKISESDAQDKEKEWKISVRYEVLTVEHYSHEDCIQLHVIGQTRDWVVLTAGELEDRIKLTHRFSFVRYITHSAAPYVVLFLSLAMAVGFFILMPSADSIHIKLEALRADGKIKDAVDAIIAVERLKEPNKVVRDAILHWIFVGLIGSAVLVVALPKLAKIIGHPYVFLWGEYVALHQRRT